MALSDNYKKFLETKLKPSVFSGFEIKDDQINPLLFDWQKVIVKWALRKGRCALFESCGLGKTPQQLEWAKHICKFTKGNVLILAPLAVSSQTVREGDKFNIKVNECRKQEDVKSGINITNYEMLDHFDPQSFSGIVLDESSILKSFTGKIRSKIIDSFKFISYKLACTATPSPNDYMELGNHSEFLGVMSRSEMLSMYFINDTSDTGTWRLKGHVKDNLFWKWMASWSVMIEKPSDIGFDDNGFILPELIIHEKILDYDGPKKTFFTIPASTLNERRKVRTESIEKRVSIASKIINKTEDICLVWCNLNAEGKLLSEKIDQSVEIKGADDNDYKKKMMLDFSFNKIKCLISKPKISGFGMNWQNCSKVFFVGLSDSYEQYYQAVRRSWRYGQKNKVHVYIIIEEREINVLKNIKRKEKDMLNMFSEMVTYMKDTMKMELFGSKFEDNQYQPQLEMILPDFLFEGIN